MVVPKCGEEVVVVKSFAVFDVLYELLSVFKLHVLHQRSLACKKVAVLGFVVCGYVVGLCCESYIGKGRSCYQKKFSDADFCMGKMLSKRRCLEN